jgi:sugar O-acyltransferase (sialic acid O-acetyltransferase NeuD family)
MINIALIGNGGHAREVEFQMGIKITKFVDDSFYVPGDSYLMPLSKFNPLHWEIMVAVGDSKDRESIIKKLPKETQYFSFVHPTVIASDDFQVGQGSFIGAYSIITTNVKIGDHCILNRGCHIGHDSIIGDYFSAMPGSIVSGDVKIGDRVYLGTNSSIRERVSICDDVTIGLNSGVYKSISAPGKYTSINQLDL